MKFAFRESSGVYGRDDVDPEAGGLEECSSVDLTPPVGAMDWSAYQS
jgi:hypothetical protein